ncbi:MAG TPA: alternative ribosome rescue aminoacyl-tRNA hydrolase ArfB [Solirubrobacteraceae bacterium]|jgi:ribosome-associated protein|nr:alternative ribosome rescue aminoacyl-tRNA hydrolase ArfB [Solirubrobacteraceae bacterium]
MTDMLVVNPDVSIPLSEITLRASRSSGPGGQHANVTASRIEACFVVADSAVLSEDQRRRVSARCGPLVTAIAQDARSQSRNRELALDRLADRLDRALAVPRPRRPTRPSAAARRRSAQAKQQHSARKNARRPPTGDDS